jgi:hypothetical protein
VSVEATTKVNVGFDGLIFPLANPLVAIEAEDGPVKGAGITWSVIDGLVVVTVEFCLKGQEPIHISFSQQEDGTFEVITPPVYLPNPREF